MKIKVNNRDKIMPDNISLTKMLEIVSQKDSIGIAIAVNQEVIPQTKWEETKLREGDNITIIEATCGG